MTTRDSVLGEYYGVASDCVERNGAIAAMADEIVRLRKIEAAAREYLRDMQYEQLVTLENMLDPTTLTPEAPTDA